MGALLDGNAKLLTVLLSDELNSLSADEEIPMDDVLLAIWLLCSALVAELGATLEEKSFEEKLMEDTPTEDSALELLTLEENVSEEIASEDAVLEYPVLEENTLDDSASDE